MATCCKADETLHLIRDCLRGKNKSWVRTLFSGYAAYPRLHSLAVAIRWFGGSQQIAIETLSNCIGVTSGLSLLRQGGQARIHSSGSVIIPKGRIAWVGGGGIGLFPSILDARKLLDAYARASSTFLLGIHEQSCPYRLSMCAMPFTLVEMISGRQPQR